MGTVVNRASWRRTWAAILAVAVAFVGSVVFLAPPAAAAPTGNFSDINISVPDDGDRSNLDDGNQNGKVGTNDNVVFAWNFTSNGITDGVITQTLPECWVWDADSLAAVNTNNANYQASFVLEDDGRTLKVTISAAAGEIGLANLMATPKSCADTTTPYTPTVTASGEDSTQDRTGTRTPSRWLPRPV